MERKRKNKRKILGLQCFLSTFLPPTTVMLIPHPFTGRTLLLPSPWVFEVTKIHWVPGDWNKELVLRINQTIHFFCSHFSIIVSEAPCGPTLLSSHCHGNLNPPPHATLPTVSSGLLLRKVNSKNMHSKPKLRIYD